MNTSRLRLALAWVAPLWFLRHYTTGSVEVAAAFHSPKYGSSWAIHFGKHHYNVDRSLRRALVAALKKLDPARAPRRTEKEETTNSP